MALFMSPSTTIHYKSAFTIRTKDQNSPTVIRKLIRSWCCNRRDIDESGRSDLARSWFFTGDPGQHVCGQCYIRTASNIGKYDNSNPEHWAFELIHGDSQAPARLWSINIGMTREDDTTIRFACLLRYGLKANHFGPQPENPTPSVPKFMRDILSDERFECLKFENKINPRLYDVGVYGGRWLAGQICDRDRRLPIIVHVNNPANGLSVDIEELFKKNIGNANAYAISSMDDLSAINMNLPYDHRLSVGMLRVYTRYSDSAGTGFRHKFYQESELQNRWVEINQEIAFALSQNALSFIPGEVIEIKHVIDKRRLKSILELRGQDASRNDSEYIKLLEDELDEKVQEISRKDEELMQIELSLEELQEKAKDLSWQAGQYAACIQEKTELEKRATAVQQEFDVPRSLREVLSLAESYWWNKILIHEVAYKSADKYGSGGDIRVVQEAWKMLNKLALVMYELKFIEQSAELENAFRARTGIEFSMTESKTTKKDKRFVKMRTCAWENAEIPFFPHLKSAVRNDFRLHFAFLEVEKKILICHCGAHLDNARTQHME